MSYFDTHYLGGSVIYLLWLQRMGFKETYTIVYSQFFNEIGMLKFNRDGYKR